MTGLGLRIDDRRLRAAVGRLAAALDDPGAALDEIARRLAASTDRRFARERGPDGARWTPSRRALREGGRTLDDSGRLRASIAAFAGEGEAGVAAGAGYAAIHQLGRGVPARPFLGLDDDDRSAALAVVRRAVERAVR